MRYPIVAALASALLFGLSTPVAKILVSEVPPVALAGLLYLGSGAGLLAWRFARSRLFLRPAAHEVPLARADWPWLAGAILAGGVVSPILLLSGLERTSGATASLLLNLEGVFTALLAWFVFHENVDRRIAIGFTLIAGGGMLLSWEGAPEGGLPLGALAIIAACLGWAIDNNLTQRVSASDPGQIAGIKGLVAGSVNLLLAVSTGWQPASTAALIAAPVLGLFGYGISLALFVWSLRHLGTARTGAYFSVAPFFGAALALLILAERPGSAFWLATVMMMIGVWLHVTERHSHIHRHEHLVHAHVHRHDEHHQHEHGDSWDGTEPHTHEHAHEPLVHAHPHYPDLHHRHRH
ncbi:MAG: EamA family transporter [Gammaproteobacteria bacterium]|nr:EamA family transporter [Gammaproteobacteria bacterium]